MNKFKICITQTVTYDHEIVVECEDDELLDDVMDRLQRVEQCAYGNFEEFIPEIEGSGGVTVIDTIEDGSGNCEWEFDYTMAD